MEIDYKKCTYFSYPMQTGKILYLEMKKENKENIADFLIENVEKAKLIKQHNELRTMNFVEDFNFSKIINPGKLDQSLLGEWKSEDFLSADLHLLSKHAEQIVFFEDWHYSLGCVEEFKLAFDLQIPMFEYFQSCDSSNYIELNQAYIRSCFEKTIEFLKMCGIKKNKTDQISICDQFKNYILIYCGGRGE